MSTVNFSIESAQEYLQHLRLEQHVQEYRVSRLEKKVKALNLKPIFVNSDGYDVDSIDTASLNPLEDFWSDEVLENF